MSDVTGMLVAALAPMREARAKLDGDVAAASAAAESFGRARANLEELRGQQSSQFTMLMPGFQGDAGNRAADRHSVLDSVLSQLAQNSADIQATTTTATQGIDNARSKVDQLIEEFLRAARPLLDAARLAAGGGIHSVAQMAGLALQQLAARYNLTITEALTALKDEFGPTVEQLVNVPPVDTAALAGHGDPLRGEAAPTISAPAGAAPAAAPSIEAPSGGGSSGGPSGGGSGSYSGGGSGYSAGGGGYSGGGNADYAGGSSDGSTATKPRVPMAIPLQPGAGVDVNLPGGGTVQAPSEQAAQAVRAALTQLGVPYVWGGTSPGEGLDCSGLTQYAYAQAGVEIPRHSADQAVGAEVSSADQLLPGDLIVWDGHVAMYIGEGQMVEAGDPVQISALRTENLGMPFIGFYRPTD